MSTLSCQQLIKYFEKKKLISKHQSGLRQKHSCTTAILRLTEDLHQSIAKNKCVIIVLLDFSNAFGSVDHNKLLQVLQSNGVVDDSLEWFSNFLRDWKQVVKLNETISATQTITRGVIQGENN